HEPEGHLLLPGLATDHRAEIVVGGGDRLRRSRLEELSARRLGDLPQRGRIGRNPNRACATPEGAAASGQPPAPREAAASESAGDGAVRRAERDREDANPSLTVALGARAV